MQTTSGVEAKVNEGTMTPSPGLRSNEISANSNASVPLEQHNTYFESE